MSKMKHLLKKLHIGGGGLHDHHHHSRLRPNLNPNPSPSPNSSSSNSTSTSTSSSSSSSDSRVIARIGGVESDTNTATAAAAADFNFLEEEFQVQLALAISASSADHVEAREDPHESAQIDAAKRISLGCSAASSTDSDSFVEFLSLRYWTYNVVNYDEKIMDGFYDAYGIKSSTVVQGKMPLLVDIQAISVSDSVDYEVILVNRLVDSELQRLEQKAIAMSRECQVAMHGPKLAGFVQNIADMVVQRMGGPVSDADEMVKRWTARSYELRSLLNTNILQLGALDIGLSRHRALLFKVLADRIDLPCKLVKGSYYTGTDDGAVNLIKVETGSEYIVDLMGAPGALIPAEVPRIYLPYPEFGGRVCPEISYSVPDQRSRMLPPAFGSSRPIEAPIVASQTKSDGMNLAERDQTERFEHDFGKLLPSLPTPMEGPSSICGKATSAQKMKVKNVSKYVITAAKNPEFAQKLHAVLLESGASPPADLFSDAHYNQRHMYDTQHLIENNGVILGTSIPADLSFSSSGLTSLDKGISGCETESFPQKQEEINAKLVTSDYRLCSDDISIGSVFVGQGSNDATETNAKGVVSSHPRQEIDFACESHAHENNDSSYPGAMEDSQSKLVEKFHDAMRIVCNCYPDNINPMLGEAAEWDIKWEDLQIGERIGIGSYGEVYRAEWNGTEVAVKKFLDQDFSGDALVQFKCEIEIMLRLRHPNVVLFMGAVTQSPHFSILTEFLPRGSLYRLLHRPNSQLDEKRRMRMALDVAKGMNYLHTSHPTIVHRDLKSPNLLVDKNWVVKVCDFGLSRMKHHTFLSSKSTAGTPEWMAPEVLRNEPANEKCDVYSFGVILWELATLSIPWKGLNPMQVVGAVGFQNRRLEIPEDVDPTVAQIIQDCWQTEPHLRPSFTQLMHRLRHLQHLVVDKKNSTD